VRRRLSYFAAAFALAAGTLVLAGEAPVVGGAAPASALPAPFIFVTNNFANSVTEYAQGANGDATPVAIVFGPHTALSSPNGAALDSVGRLFVTNFTPAVRVYAQGAHDDASPSATIGPGAGLGNPQGENFDAAGNLWVANPLAGVNSVTEYANPAAGGSAPTATIQGPSTGLNVPVGVAVESDGTVVVSNSDAPGGGSITFYPPGHTGDAAPIRTISGNLTGLNTPRQLTLDAAGNIFVANEQGGGGSGSVTEYPAGANGNVTPTIDVTGSNTGMALPQGIALDSDGHIYVTNVGADTNGVGINSVTEYAAGVTGNVNPIATIRGPHTGINAPVGIAVVRTAAPLTCPPGTSICLIGRNIPGSVNVPAGQSLFLQNSTVGGSVNASNPSSITVCNTTVNGSMTISGATGFVLLGDPSDDNCPGNTVRGNVTLQNNTGGLELESNHISGNAAVFGNSGLGRVPGEDDRPEIEVNTIGGYLACSGNSPGVKNDGPPNNTVTGARSGQCAAPF
jgi:hypothetical protein